METGRKIMYELNKGSELSKSQERKIQKRIDEKDIIIKDIMRMLIDAEKFLDLKSMVKWAQTVFSTPKSDYDKLKFTFEFNKSLISRKDEEDKKLNNGQKRNLQNSISDYYESINKTIDLLDRARDFLNLESLDKWYDIVFKSKWVDDLKLEFGLNLIEKIQEGKLDSKESIYSFIQGKIDNYYSDSVDTDIAQSVLKEIYPEYYDQNHKFTCREFD